MIARRALLAVAGSLVLTGLLGACDAQQAEPEGPDYADDDVIKALAEGLEKRFDIADEREESGKPQTAETFSEAASAELDALEPFRGREFEDHDLQEEVISYINIIEDSVELTEKYPTDSVEFSDGWTDLYEQRVMALKTFVDNYGLTVDKAHEATLNELLVEANAAGERVKTETAIEDLVGSIVFTKKDEGYGAYTYTATVQNTTGINFGYVSLTLGLYDSEGVKAEESYASTSSWPAGETVRFEAYGRTDAVQIKVSVNNYEIDD